MVTNMETTTPLMEELATAFGASVTMSANNSSPATPPRPAIASTSTSTIPEMEMVLHMEKLVAAFAAASVGLAAPPQAHAAASSTTTTPSSHTATTTTMRKEEDDREPVKGEEACVLRVRFPDGRVLCRSFGAGRPVAALFRYCRSVLLAAGSGAGRRAFQIVRLAGGASDEVRAGSSSFRELGLHRCTVHVVLPR